MDKSELKTLLQSAHSHFAELHSVTEEKEKAFLEAQAAERLAYAEFGRIAKESGLSLDEIYKLTME